MSDADLTSADIARLDSTTQLMDHQWAPCRWNCPVHADVRSYIEQAAMGNFGAAIDIIRERLPFASVCGRICHHPCEANCRRQDVDDSVAIREVKRFVAELAGAKGATVNKPATQDKAPIAIIGGGPAGLAAALELAKLGYRPTVFEKFPIAGGIPATAIPKYRLPRDVIQMDVDWILAHGVGLQTGVEIGKDKTIADLRSEGFAAVLIATGLSLSRTLPMPGGDHPRVLPVLKFLEAIAFDRRPDIGKDVLVIGGGNVAVDAARSAVRLGAARVRMMMLEDETEMPAWSWEQHEALEEGITFIHRRGPVEVVAANGNIKALKARKVTRVFDDSKRFSPTYDDADVQTIECDTIILAIGQMGDMGFVKATDLQVDQRGRLAFDRATHKTNVTGVFACGEIVTPPGSAVEACASGQRAALAIHQELSGQPIVLSDTLPPAIDKIPQLTAAKVLKADRMKVAVLPPEMRKATFGEMDSSFSECTAMTEARRCMNCGSGAQVLVDKCAACLTCLRVCPFDIPKVTDVARIDSALCQACGLCMAACPANAIVPKGHAPRLATELAAQAVARLNTPRKIVAFVSAFHACADALRGRRDDTPAGVAEVFLPSISKLGAADLLAAIENGADGVIVVAETASDRYPTTNHRVRAYVDQVRGMLKEIGLSPEKVQMIEAAGQPREKVVAAIAEAAAKI